MSKDETAPSNSGSAHRRVSDQIPFSNVAKLLEKIETTSTGSAKLNKLKEFFTYFRKRFKEVHGTLDSTTSHGDSLYCLARLFIPSEDLGRSAYGFKGSKLGQMLAEVLGIDKKTPQGKKLYNFKDPTVVGSGAGDLSTVIYPILERLQGGKECKELMVTNLHKMLDKLAKNARSPTSANEKTTIEEQRRVLKSLFLRVSATEGKWLIRILLKKVGHGLNSTQVFQCIHPKAKEMYETVRDLEQVCQYFNDPSTRFSGPQIELFKTFRPMLCARLDIVGDDFEGDSQDEPIPKKKGRNAKDKLTLPAAPFIIETKWDGERFQIHYNGNEMRYFTRNGFEYPRFDETLRPRLEPLIREGVQSFILDGEMMAWQKSTGMYVKKGNKIDVKQMNADNNTYCPTYVAYDIVYYNGESIMSQPLRRRRELISQVITPHEGIFQISEHQLVSTKQEVMNALNEAIDNLDEGIVVKDLNSSYEVGKRAPTWLKIKPEYVDGCSVDDMDLLILGAYYTESTNRGRGRNDINHFLVGILGENQELYPLAKVGSGRLRNPEVEQLVKYLQPYFVKKTFPNVKLKGRRQPDLSIDPRNSVVVQVKATEIIWNDAYDLNYTVRFPRITKIRRDKPWDEIMTVAEFHRIRESTAGSLAKRTDGRRNFRNKRPANPSHSDDDNNADKTDDEEEDSKNPLPTTSYFNAQKTKVSPVKLAMGKGKSGKMGPLSFPKKNEETISGIFGSKVFLVCGSTKWKGEMEKTIQKAGGEITQNPVKDMFAMIGENVQVPRIQIAIRSRTDYVVMKPDWITKSIEAQEELPFRDSYFWRVPDAFKRKNTFLPDEPNPEDSMSPALKQKNTARKVTKCLFQDSDSEEETLDEPVQQKEQTANPTEITHDEEMNTDETFNEPPVSSDEECQLGVDDMMEELFADVEKPRSSTVSPTKRQKIMIVPSEQSSPKFDSLVIKSNTPSPVKVIANMNNLKTPTKNHSIECATPTSSSPKEESPSHSKDNIIDLNFMKPCVVAFRGEFNSGLADLVEFFGGAVASDEMNDKVTHVIVKDRLSPAKKQHLSAFIVKPKWLDDCFSRKELLDEFMYTW